jgi:hypothetical protein
MADTPTVPTITTHHPGWQAAWRWLLRSAVALVLLVMAVATAWVLSNLQDAGPVPRPAALAPPTQQLSPDRNAAFALAGLFAAEGKDPAHAGRALWAAEEAQVQQLLKTGRLIGPDMPNTPSAGARLAVAQGTPWVCEGLTTPCWAVWRGQSTALVTQRESMATLGARCEALVPANPQQKPGFEFEELLPKGWHPSGSFVSHAHASTFCAKWLHTGAALAQQQGRKADAVQLMHRASQLHRALLAGSHTLVAQSVADPQLRRHLAMVAAMAAQTPAWAADLAPLLAPLGAPEARVRRWIVAEAAYNQGALAAMAPNSAQSAGLADYPSGDPPSPWHTRVVSAVTDWLTTHHIGWHPQRTMQLFDARWLAQLQQLDAGLPSALGSSSQPLRQGGDSPLRWWHNPAGRMVVEITEGAYTSYLRRPLDLQLHQEAVALALQVHSQQVPAAARAAWAQQQPVSATLRERLSWAADGSSLQVRSWAADALPAGETLPERDRIHVLLQPAIP